ncbi:YIP1 family protein [Natronococcus pandeyae]|uniref:YIP1 family protein n=1 Tax=Natronococcus pandeyae TaxID=2055836 RepID=A0A8J8Q6C5_9EURY|nr:YIP1 family protein [Natronococcus pandeyae]TYL40231.1 YIP1 family protein [Natronococcus pandeyae]
MAPQSPLVSPAEYFEQEPHNPHTAGLVVFIGYLVVSIAMFALLVNVIFGQVENAPPEFDRAVDQAVSEIIVPMTFFLVLISVLALLVIAALMHYLSGGSRTAGSFGNAVAVAGWAYAPNLLTLPLSYAHARYEIQQQTFDGSDPQTLERQLEMAQLDGTGLVPFLLLVVTVGWSVYILAYGTAATHDVDLSDALLPAAIVGIGAFVFGVV